MSSTATADGRRFYSSKYFYEDDLNGRTVDKVDNAAQTITAVDVGETDRLKAPRDLSKLIDSTEQSWFKYFLDGSRRIFKVDDVEFDGNIYPIVAGQIGIGCCRRDERKIKPEFFERQLVLVLPTCALSKGQKKNYLSAKLLDHINASSTLKRFGLTFDKILLYNLDIGLPFDAKAIIAVHDYMIEREKRSVMRLADGNKLRQGAYLIKDGSLEYKIVKDAKYNLSALRLKGAFDYILGVSKTFNPLQCFVRPSRNKLIADPTIVARLRQFERTPAYRYRASMSGEEIYFCVWYVRLHERKSARNAFDGVLKVEKLMQASEVECGVDSERIDRLSAQLMSERNPVCYGADPRWANHIYPMYVTEQFAKSNYISRQLFLNLF